MQHKKPGPTADEVFEALRGAFDVRGRTAGLVDIRRSRTDADAAVLIFAWPPEDRLFGVPLSLTRIDRRLDGDQPARDLNDWMDSVGLWILEDVDNGLVHRGRRRSVDDYIELTQPAWPQDERFYLQVNTHFDTETTLLEDLKEAGLDAGLALEAQHDGRLLGWTFAYENNSSGSPIVGHSTIVQDGSDVPRLVEVALAVDVPSTVALELVRAATHAAAEHGARTVEARDPVLAHLRSLHPDIPQIAGFGAGPQGHFVTTDFLGEDAVLADNLFQESLLQPGLWGGNRDRAGRYLPNSRLLRVLHGLRYGQSGLPPRIYLGLTPSVRYRQ